MRLRSNMVRRSASGITVPEYVDPKEADLKIAYINGYIHQTEWVLKELEHELVVRHGLEGGRIWTRSAIPYLTSYLNHLNLMRDRCLRSLDSFKMENLL